MKDMGRGAVPKLRFPGFEGAWEEAELGDIVDFKSGGTPSKDVPSYWGGDIPWISAASMHDDKITTSERSVTRLGSENGTRKAEANTVLMLVRGSMLYNRIPAGICDRLVTFNQDVKALASKGDESPSFILASIRAKESKLLSMVTGTGIGAGKLDTEELKQMVFNKPTLPEQRKIASFLSAVDTKIAHLSRKKALLEDYKKGSMQQIFSQKMRFKDEDGRAFPEWKEKRLGDVATFSKGKGISKADIAEEGENLCVRYGELYTEYGEFIAEVVSRTDTPLKGAVISRKNDVLMPTSDVTPNGLATASAIDIEGVVLGGDILIIRSKEILNRFFAYFVAANKPMIMRLVSGATVYHIYGSDLANLYLAIPHPAEQHKIAAFLSALDTKIDLVGKELTHARSFKQGLLQQMFV